MPDMNNVSIVVENNLCNGCCECISACSSNNICIMMNKVLGHPVPYIAAEDCSNCGECLKLCPQSQSITRNPA